MKRFRSRRSPDPESVPPPAPCTDILDLLARCLAVDDNRAWCELIACITPLARHNKILCSSEQSAEFAGWLQGWPRLYASTGYAYKNLRDAIANNPAMPEQERQQIFKAYFTYVIRSAVIDYLKEVQPHTMNVPLAPDEQPSPGTEPDDAQTQRVAREVHVENWLGVIIADPRTPDKIYIDRNDPSPALHALAALDPAYRVPFKLTHMPDDLDNADLEWIAQQTGRGTPHDIGRLIDDQRAMHASKKYPLSGEFIADLLGLTPATVSQRVRRAVSKLIAQLTTPR